MVSVGPPPRPRSPLSHMWVRRASIVGLIPRAAAGSPLDSSTNAERLHCDANDLIQRRGVYVREAGKDDIPGWTLPSRPRRQDSPRALPRDREISV